MNVIFLDFDGVLDTIHYNSMDDIERRIKVLSDICSEFNCKVVIEASAKDAIDEETMCVYNDRSWVKSILNLFDKYDIDCIGRTPNVEKDGFNVTSIKFKTLQGVNLLALFIFIIIYYMQKSQ